jgi:hypothetical protein
MDNHTRLFYTSPNGDRWLLVKIRATGEIMIRHEPNDASGGKTSEVDVETFAASNSGSPEQQALTDLIRQLRAHREQLKHQSR